MIDLDFNGTNFRVFAPIADIDAWIAADITRAMAWNGRSDDLKAQAAIATTRFLSTLRWKGTAASEPDAWPREGIRDVEETETPAAVLQAYFMLSADVATTPNLFEEFAVTSANGARGPITKVKAGSAEVHFADVASKSTSTAKPILPNPTPDNVFALLRPYLRLGSGSAGLAGPIVHGTEEYCGCDDFEKI